MTDNQSTLELSCGAIRAASADGRLCALGDLPALVAEAQASAAARAAADPRAAPTKDAGAPTTAASIEAALSADAPDDIKMMRGKDGPYYFSELSMTAAYAKHLFRVAEKDPPRLVAETARDESRIYPRPASLGSLLEPPFSLSADELARALAEIAERPEYADIRRCAASNGDEYVYSDAHLSPAHAESLAEWASVGEKDNP